MGILMFEQVSRMTRKLIDTWDNKLNRRVSSDFRATTLYICETEDCVLMKSHVFRGVTPCAMTHSAAPR